MSSPRTYEPHRVAAAFALTLLIALFLPLLPPTAGAAEKVRTDAGDLPGYIVTGKASPLSMLMYEEVIPVPVEPGEPHGEGSLSYTNTNLETGPTARAVASSFWPGAAMGDGFNTICQQGADGFNEGIKDTGQKVPDCSDEARYHVKSESVYPGKEEAQTDNVSLEPTGSGMKTSARGLDVMARASSAVSPNEEAMGLGNASSRSESTVKKSKAIGSTVSSVEDISLGGGVITIESVKTVLEATSSAKKANTSGVTKVSGLVIGGHGYTIDSKGLQPVADGKTGDSEMELPAMPGAKEMNEQLGIQVELAKHKETVNGADATREAGGLRISIRTAVLKQALTNNVPVGQVFDSLPEEVSAHFAALVALAPQIDFVFGRGSVRAAGSTAIDLGAFELPPLPPPPAPAAAAAAPGPTSLDEPVTGGDALEPAVAEETVDTGGGELTPVAAGAATAPAAAQIPLSGGVPAALTAAGIALAALGGRGLAGLTGAAMAGGGGARCERGALRKVPNLRS